MSAEVVDSNPYSRLMALKRMGIVNNYENIRTLTVAVVVRRCCSDPSSALSDSDSDSDCDSDSDDDGNSDIGRYKT